MQTKSSGKVKRDRKSLYFNKNLGLEIEDPSQSSRRNYPQTLSLLKGINPKTWGEMSK